MNEQDGREEIRVAIVACGALTEWFYAPALKALSTKQRVTVAALMDPQPARLAAIGTVFPDSRCASRLSDIPDDIDLAIVASPAGFHAEQTIELLGCGMNVLCEKPMAATVAECEAMIEAARRADRLLAVGHFKRFFPATQQIKQLVEAQVFGPVRSFRFVEGGKFGWPAQSRAFFDKRSGGGGVLIDIGVYPLDFALWWFGPPARLTCEDDAMGGVEANCWVQLSYQDGMSGEVGVSRDWDVPNRYFIQCERGWIAWDPVDANHLELGWGDRYALKATTHELVHGAGLPMAAHAAATRHRAFMQQIEDVLDAIRRSRPPAVTGEDGRRVMTVIEECYRTSALMDIPWLSAAERRKGRELRCSP